MEHEANMATAITPLYDGQTTFPKYSTEISFILRSRFGEVCYCCSYTLLLGSAWVLLKYVLQTIFWALYILE